MKTRAHSAVTRRKSSRLLSKSKTTNLNLHSLSLSSAPLLPEIPSGSGHDIFECEDSTDSQKSELVDSISSTKTAPYSETSSLSTKKIERTRKERNREASRKTRERKKTTEKSFKDKLKNLDESLIPSVEEQIRTVTQDTFLIKTALELSHCPDLIEKRRQLRSVERLETIVSGSSTESSESP